MLNDAASKPSNVLIIDDDAELVDLLQDYLELEGFSVGRAEDGETGVREALSGAYAIAVVDMMMPRLSGIDVLKVIRAQSILPVIMLTAKGDDIDRIIGLEIGADDYISKPCSPRELLARIRAVLRRTHLVPTAVQAAAIRAGAIVMNPLRRQVECAGKSVDLTSTEFNLLEVLARHPGAPVSKKELSELGLGRPIARFDRSIDVHVSSIRQKLGPSPSGQPRILTVRGFGYQLVPE
ncbi:MAG: response regulator transcription factor [Steroidobacteraceae bacterium]|jgi:two-component system OmpR family response regulator